MFQYSKKEFINLNTVYNINTKYQDSNSYDDNTTDEIKAEKNVQPVKAKIIVLRELISNTKYFKHNFEIDACYLRKQQGKYRSNLWVWIVYKKQYETVKKIYKKGIPYQLYLPQIQSGISYEGAAYGEIWLEDYAMKNYKEKFIEILSKSNIEKNKLKLYVIFKDKNAKTFSEYYNSKSIRIFKKLVLSRDAKKAGIFYWDDKSKVAEKNIEKEIIKSLTLLEKEIYSKLFDDISSVSYKEKPHIKTRKPSTKDEVTGYLRKGSKPTKVNLKHNKIKKDLCALFKVKFLKAKIEPEKDFIDIRVEGKDFIYLYEIKTSPNPVKCIREALGQILYYLWTQKIPKNKSCKLIIIGMKDLEVGMDKFFKFVQENTNVEVEYDSVENLLKGNRY